MSDRPGDHPEARATSTPSGSASVPPESERANRLAKISLAMVPAFIISAVAAGITGFVLLNAKGFEGSESMSVQGGYGWFVLILTNLLIILLPQYVGLALGIKARRLGAGRLATVGIAVNAAMIALWIAVVLLGVL